MIDSLVETMEAGLIYFTNNCHTPFGDHLSDAHPSSTKFLSKRVENREGYIGIFKNLKLLIVIMHCKLELSLTPIRLPNYIFRSNE